LPFQIHSGVMRNSLIGLLPISLGIVAFFLVVGVYPLIPTNIAWLSGQDPSQHYLGWGFFRYSPWTNPIGLNPSYGLEIANAIAFSDSIPWMAYLFKLFSPILPEPFQYIGLWILLCFILQAWFSWKLAKLITPNVLLQVFICCLLGVFAPPMLKRLGLHAALMGHFLILAALYLNLSRTTAAPTLSRSTCSFILSWILLCALAALTNIYLLVMVFGLWCASMLDRIRLDHIPAKSIFLEIILVSGVIILCLWQTGYFVGSGTPIVAEGFGQYKLNLLSLFDAGRFSYILKSIPHPEDLEEGFNFLGLGILGILALSLMTLTGAWVMGKAWSRRSSVDIARTPNTIGPVLILSLAVFTAFALSNQISLGMWTWTYPLSESVLQTAGILRSSGRFFWPVYYVLVFLLLRWVINHYSLKKAQLILGAALAIQIIDTSAGWLALRNTFTQLSIHQKAPALSGPFWDSAAKRYTKIVIWPLRSGQTQEHWQAISYFASQHQMGTNAVYLGRRADPTKVEQSNQTVLAQLESGQLSADTLYILSNTPKHQEWLFSKRFAPDTCLMTINELIVIGRAWPSCAPTK